MARSESDHRDGKEVGADDWEWAEVRRVCMRVAYRYAKNHGEIEDIVQESLLRAWRNRGSLRDPASRDYWLAAIVRNEAFRVGSKRRPEPVETLEQDLGAVDERVEGLVESADLHEAVEGLSERDRLLVRLRYEQDLTQPGIALRLGIPEGTVKVRLHRARAKLRRELERVEG